MKVAVLGMLMAWSSGSLAGEVFTEDVGLVEFLPIADVVADGVTAVPIHFLALDGDGEGILGIEAKLTASSGVLQEWTDQGAGLYQVMWTPPKAEVLGTTQITLKGKTPTKYTIKRGATIRTRPWPKSGVSVSVNPPQLSSGLMDTATLNLSMADTLTPTTPEDMTMSVSEGTLADMTQMGGNRFMGRYEAPVATAPLLAVVTLSDSRSAERSYGAFAIPIAVSRKEIVQAPPGSDVILRIGEREFGPIKASKRGKAEFEILATPGVRDGILTIVENGNRTEKAFSMDWTSSRRIQWIPASRGLPGDSHRSTPVRVAVFDERGAPDPSADLKLSVSAGQIGLAEYEGDGIYVADYTAPDASEMQSVQLGAAIAGEDKQTDVVTLRVVPARPESVVVESTPQSLSGAKEVQLCATVTGPNDLAMSSTEVQWSLTGGVQQGEPTKGANGCSGIRVKTYGAGLQGIATTGTLATGNPLHRVVLINSGGVPADGVSSSMLTVMTLDTFGYPVANISVRLLIEGGDGSLPQDATSNERGVAQVYYTAGREPGLIRVRANAGQSSAVVGFLQGPAILSNRVLPSSGSVESSNLTSVWERTVGRISLAP